MNTPTPVNKTRNVFLGGIDVPFMQLLGFNFVYPSLTSFNLMQIGYKTLWVIILGLYSFMANATELNNTPLYSQVTINVINNSSGLMDKTIVGFNPNSTDTFNPVYDANKLQGGLNRETLYTLNSGQWMAINTLPCEATADTVNMGFEPGTNSTFIFSFTGMSTFDSTSYVYLEDKQTHTMHDLRNGDYSFASSTTDDPDRFLLHFTPPLQIIATDSACTSISTLNILQPGNASWNYTLVDSGSDYIVNGILNQSQPVTVQVSPGTYVLTVTDSNNYKTTKTIQIISGPQVTAAAFLFSADSVQTGQNITLSATDTGIVSNQWSFGNGSYASEADTSVSYTVPGIYNLSLTVTNQAGCNSTKTQTILVRSPKTTGLTEVGVSENPEVRSYAGKIYVTFNSLPATDATISIYNILGQVISNEHFTGSGIYDKELGNTETGYLLVTVWNNGSLYTKKVFVTKYK